MGAVSDLQVKRAGQLVTGAGQRFDVLDFPEMVHLMHAHDPELFTRTVVDWSSTLAAIRLPMPALPRSTQVLIAGGGPVGLAAAVELGRRGIECVVIEPRDSPSRTRPRCKTINVRTLEHLRRWGIAERLRERAPLPASWSNDIVFCTSLTGWELSRFTGVLGLVPDGDRYPEVGQQAPQYVLEELLRDAVGRARRPPRS